MKRIAFWLLLSWVGTAIADNVSVPTKPYTFTPHTAALSSQVNSDFDTLFTAIANIGTANIIANGVGTTQLAASSVTATKLDATTVSNYLVPTGTVEDYIGTSLPTGWVWANGQSIGDASSGASQLANPSTQALFILIYNSMGNSQAAVSGGRSGSGAAADFTSHKNIALPDLRDRIVAGNGVMGTSAGATRITTAVNFDATINGNAGGAEKHTLTTTEIPAHTHTLTDPGHTHQVFVSFNANYANVPSSGGSSVNAGGNTIATASNTTGITVNSSGGSGGAHTVLQPTYVLYKIIKL